jgi:hypothetical protein
MDFVSAGFEAKLDWLLLQLCPDWSVPVSWDGEPVTDDMLVGIKRIHVGQMLKKKVQQARQLAPHVLEAIAADRNPSFNRYLIEPLLHAVGPKPILEYLLAGVASGSPRQQVCAANGLYWAWALGTRALTDADRARLQRETLQVCGDAFANTDDPQVRTSLTFWLGQTLGQP